MLAPQVTQEMSVLPVTPEIQATMDLLALEEQLEQPVQQVMLEVSVTLETPVTQDLMALVDQAAWVETQAQPAMQETSAHPEIQATQEQMVQLVTAVLVVQQEHLATLETLANKAAPVAAVAAAEQYRRGRQDLPALRVVLPRAVPVEQVAERLRL